MPLGGSIKLTGESEYRKAIKNITQDLQSMSKTLKNQTADFASNNKSISANATEQKKLNETIKSQQSSIEKAKNVLAGYTVELTKQQTKHNALTKEYRNAVLELDKIKKASGETSDAYKKQESVVDQLSIELEDSTRAMNKSKEAMNSLKSEINNSQKTINNTEKSLNDLGNSAEDSGEKAKKSGDGFTVFKGILADLSSRAIASAVSGLKQLGGALISLGKQAYANYGEYEQLVGGVETLFGESADELINYANKAYKTAGLSANQYMEQATSFSATLLQGLGGDTEKAVKYADMAIIDMADNANKMGTDITMIQNAYQGFAKDNYTMLDNLKLGYGGTQSEMARLINDSGVLGDAVEVTAQTVKDVPFDKMIEAIHKIQQEIGITGTTTLEAEGTIQGSTASMKASWENLLTGIADEKQDISPLVDNFVEQVIALAKNSAPRIKQIIQGIGELVSAMWNEVLPQLADSVPELEPFISKLLWLRDNAKLIGIAIGGIATAIAGLKIYNFAKDVAGAVKDVKNFVKQLDLAKVKTVALELAQKAQVIATNAVAVAQKALNAVMAFASANPMGAIIIAITAIVGAFVLLWNKSEAFRDFWIGLWDKVKKVVGAVADWFSETWTKVIDFFKEIFSTVATWFNDNVVQPLITFFSPLIEFFKTAFENIIGFAQGCWNIIKRIWEVVSGWFNSNVIEPVVGFFKGLWDKVSNFASTTWDAIKGVWETVSGWFNETIITPVTGFFKGMWDGLKNGAKGAWEGIKNVFSNVVGWFKDKFSKAWQAVKNVFSTGGKVFDGIKDGITKAFKTVVNAIIKGINKVIAIPFKAINKALRTIRDISFLGISPFKGLLKEFDVPQIPLLAKGGILKRGQVGLLEGNGTEAVVPLEQNTEWTRRVASQISQQLETQNRAETTDYGNLVSAFKEALMQVKIELDDEEMGSFVDKTISRLVYS